MARSSKSRKSRSSKSRAAPRPTSTRPAPPSSTPRPSRDQRLAQQQQAERWRRRRNIVIATAMSAAIIALIVSTIVNHRHQQQRLHAVLTAGGCRTDSRADPDGVGVHVADPVYQVNPPAGGPHIATPAPSGFYTTDDAPPDGKVVHSLEHGYIDIWYHPDLSQQDIAALRSLDDEFPIDVLMIPRPSMSTLVAATAWDHRLLCPNVQPGPLAAFVKAYRNKGPERIPHQ